MATSPRNIMYRKYLDVISFNVPTGTDINEGDIVCYDSGTHMIRPITGTGDMDYQLGDVQGTSPVAYHTPSAARRNPTVGVNIGPHTVKLIARNVAPFYKYTPVYFSTDAQSFAISGSTTPLGCMFLSSNENGGTDSGTTVIGQEYEVLLREAYLPSGMRLGQ